MANKADKKQKMGLIVMLLLCAVMVYTAEPIYKALKSNETVTEAKELNDGSYTSEISLGENGKSIVKMTVESGMVKELSWDVENADGSLKSDLSKSGAYVMTETGLKWHEQSELLSNHVISNNSDEDIVINEEGKLDGEIDGLSGVSIAISDFKAGVEECFNQAKANS